MTSEPPPSPTPPSATLAGHHGAETHVQQDIGTVQGGGVAVGVNQGSITVTIGKRDVRAEELAYLDGLVAKFRYWAEKYTPLAGIAEVRKATAEGPRLDLPMLFTPPGFEKLEEHGFGMERRTERVPVEDLRDAVAQSKRLVLLGEPGSGKSTTLWRLAYDLAIAAKEDPQAPLPLFVPLGGYTGPEGGLAYAQGYFEELGPYLPTYLRSRRVVLLLDALNEMPHTGYKERVGRIQTLLDQHPDLSVVVTCRALDYVETLRLEKLEVKPLDPERQREYLHRYLGQVDGDKLFQKMGGAALATRRRGSQGDPLPPLLALGRNPYMLVLTAKVYADKKGALPPNRGRLFAAFVSSLLAREQERDQKRSDPASWPGADTLRRSLARLAYAMQTAGERGTAVDDRWAEQQIEQCGVDARRVVNLCVSATLLDTANGRLRFVHQLIQEYFAALALEEQLRAGDDLRSYWTDDWTQPSGWEETFILLAGVLPDMTLLIERLLPIHPALAARCIAESGGERPDQKIIDQIQKGLVSLATSHNAPVVQRNVSGDGLNHVGDPRPGVGLRADGLPDIVWCPVPDGEFIMGNTKQTDQNAYDGEMPQHRPALPAFEISKYTITNAQFDPFVQDGGYKEKWRSCWTEAGWRWKEDRVEPQKYGGVYSLPNHPVVGIAWYEAVAFCNWLGLKLGRPVSLPSEAQWERAARHTDGRRYPWVEQITPDHANYSVTGIRTTTAVGIFPKGASQCGALDMSGNVWEWCQTKWREDYSTAPDDGLEGTEQRMVRGGSFHDYARNVRCAVRFRNNPLDRYRNYGFRVVVASP